MDDSTLAPSLSSAPPSPAATPPAMMAATTNGTNDRCDDEDDEPLGPSPPSPPLASLEPAPSPVHMASTSTPRRPRPASSIPILRDPAQTSEWAHIDDRGDDTVRPEGLGLGHHGLFYDEASIDQERHRWENKVKEWKIADRDYAHYRIVDAVALRLNKLHRNGWRWWKGVPNKEREVYITCDRWFAQQEVLDRRNRLEPVLDLTSDDGAEDDDRGDDRGDDHADDLPVDHGWYWDKGEDADAWSMTSEEYYEQYARDPWVFDPERFRSLPSPPPLLAERELRYKREVTDKLPASKKRKLSVELDEWSSAAAAAATEAGPTASSSRLPSVELPLPNLEDLGPDLAANHKGENRATPHDLLRVPIPRRPLPLTSTSPALLPRERNWSAPRRLFSYGRKKRIVRGQISCLPRPRAPLHRLADPAQNPRHEQHLFDHFNMSLPTSHKTRGAFGLRDFALSRTQLSGARQFVDLLSLDASNRDDLRHLELVGWAFPTDESDIELAEEWHDIDEEEGREFTGRREVHIAANDLVGLVPRLGRDGTLPCLYLSTRLATYRFELPRDDYVAHFDRAALFMNLFIFGRENHVLGQNKRPVEELIEDLLAKLKRKECFNATRPALEKLQEEYQLPLPLGSYCDQVRSEQVTKQSLGYLLQQHLVTTPFVSPVVYKLVAPHLEAKALRTDFDAKVLEQTWTTAEKRADEDALEEVKEAMFAWMRDKHAPPCALLSKRGLMNDPTSLCQLSDEPRVRIGLYDAAQIGDEIFSAGDTVLVAGESATELKQEQKAAKDRALGTEANPGEHTDGNWIDERVSATLSESGVEIGTGQGSQASSSADAAQIGEDSTPPVPWYAKIVYFARYDQTDEASLLTPTKGRGKGKGKGDSVKKVHLSFLAPLRDTPLGALAHARALAYWDHCETVDVSSIAKKIKIVELPRDSGVVPTSGWYYSTTWDNDSNAYVDSHPVEYPEDPDAYELCDQGNVPRCSSCNRRAVEARTSTRVPNSNERTNFPVWVGDLPEHQPPAFKLGDHTYHLNDYVYLLPTSEPGAAIMPPSPDYREPYLLARLLGVGDLKHGSRRRRRALPPFDANTNLHVEWLVRFDDLGGSREGRGAETDERRLVLTDIENKDVSWYNLEGTFRLETWDEVLDRARQLGPPDLEAKSPTQFENFALACLGQLQDVFYISHGTSFIEVFDNSKRAAMWKGWSPPHRCAEIDTNNLRRLVSNELAELLSSRCVECDQKFRAEQERRKKVDDLIVGDPTRFALNAISPYSGIDLLGEGISRACKALSVQVAIEQNDYVAAALKKNGKVVFNCATSDYFEALYLGVDVQVGDQELGRHVHLYPGDVHLIQSGPPCQGFSSQNMFKRQDDVRCLEPFVWLSLVEHYRPLFAVFENVSAIQEFVLPRCSEKGGLLRLLMSSLIQLGYQVRFDIHNAAAFATPQSRRRVILTCARRGCRLPKAPQPTHAYTDAYLKTFAAPYDNGTKVHTHRSSSRRHGSAPHPAVTVQAALNDLPSFGFADPFGFTPPEDDEFAWEPFQAIGYREDDRPVGRAFYVGRRPRSSFQHSVRLRTLEDGQVDFASATSNHIVPPVSERRASVFANISKSSFSDPTPARNYEDVPLEVTVEYADGREATFPLRPKLPPKISESGKRDFWARLKWNQVVSTLVTSMQPEGYWHGPRIHPVDNRQLSIRESARIMGCPDYISLDADDWDEDVSFIEKYKAIGNAVPVPLAEAIGREIHRVVEEMVLDYDQARGDGDDDGGNLFTSLWCRLEKAKRREERTHGVLDTGKGKAVVVREDIRRDETEVMVDDSDEDSDDVLVIEPRNMMPSHGSSSRSDWKMNRDEVVATPSTSASSSQDGLGKKRSKLAGRAGL